jgi:hypothetical protein
VPRRLPPTPRQGTSPCPSCPPRRSVLAALALGTVVPAVAAANAGPPNVHTPRLYGIDSKFADPATTEFGGRFEVYIGNSVGDTEVVACVSRRCRRLYQSGDNRYGATGTYFGLTLKRGQRRTVSVNAANPGAGALWGPTKVSVR